MYVLLYSSFVLDFNIRTATARSKCTDVNSWSVSSTICLQTLESSSWSISLAQRLLFSWTCWKFAQLETDYVVVVVLGSSIKLTFSKAIVALQWGKPGNQVNMYLSTSAMTMRSGPL